MFDKLVPRQATSKQTFKAFDLCDNIKIQFSRNDKGYVGDNKLRISEVECDVPSEVEELKQLLKPFLEKHLPKA